MLQQQHRYTGLKVIQPGDSGPSEGAGPAAASSRYTCSAAAGGSNLASKASATSSTSMVSTSSTKSSKASGITTKIKIMEITEILFYAEKRDS